MVMDVDNVQDGETSVDTGDSSGDEQSQPQTLTMEAVEKLIQEKTEALDREWQSKKDKEVERVRRELNATLSTEKSKADAANKALESLKARIGSDPEVSQAIEQAKLESELEHYRNQVRQQESLRRTTDAETRYHQETAGLLTAMGVDPLNPEIAKVANEHVNQFGQARNQELRGKLIAKAGGMTSSNASSKQIQALRDEIANLRREAGLDSPDVSTPAGTSSSNKEFMKKFASGDVPLSKTNLDRYNKLTKEE